LSSLLERKSATVLDVVFIGAVLALVALVALVARGVQRL
jgi:hypothetical protein